MENLALPTYVFYFPYRGVGGVPVLFLRLAEYLAEAHGQESYVVDYSDGFMAKNRTNALVKLIAYEDDQPVHVPDGSILILQSDLPWGIPQNLVTSSSTKIFFWNCYPFNLIPTFPSPIKEFTSQSLLLTKIFLNTLLLLAKINTRHFLKKLLESNAISFMDGPNLVATTYCLDVKISAPQFLPIFIKKSAREMISSNSMRTHLTLCWVGRVADFKIHILNRVIEDCYEYSLKTQTPIEFIIVGSGGEENRLFSPDESAIFKLTKIQYLAEKELNLFLQEKVDCLFAMGTSALEGAKLAVPVVLLNFSYKKVKPGYRYQFLFEANNYSLGDIIGPKDYRDGKKIDEVLELMKGNNKTVLSERCYDYFLTNHTLEKNFQRFLDQTTSSKLSYSHLISTSNLGKPFFYIAWKYFKKILSLRK